MNLQTPQLKKGSSVQGSFSDGMIEKENRERNFRESSVEFFIFEEIIQIVCPFGAHNFCKKKLANTHFLYKKTNVQHSFVCLFVCFSLFFG